MKTGPRPMKPVEWEAYTLHLQRVSVETIEEQTGLRRPRIAAAVDLGRLHAQAALQEEAAPEKPTVQTQPIRIRRAVMPQLPGATIPPPPVRPAAEPAAAVADPVPVAEPVPVADPKPTRIPKPGPDLDSLARSPEVRTWAAADGWVVPTPGLRLPGGIVLAYLRAHGGTQ